LVINDTSFLKLYDEVDGEPIFEDFVYVILQCSTCSDWSLIGGFDHELPKQRIHWPLLYPESSELSSSVPDRIRRIYSEAARIKRSAPNAFAGQVRRALEAVCADKKASGRTLARQLNSLVEMGIIPPTLAEMTSIIRTLGNIGAHAGETEVSPWDSDSIDEFFRSIVEYVYVAPSRVQNLTTRLAKAPPERPTTRSQSA
jgi:hypothetical protein